MDDYVKILEVIKVSNGSPYEELTREELKYIESILENWTGWQAMQGEILLCMVWTVPEIKRMLH